MTGIFQTSLPYDVTERRPLPGIAPLDIAKWLLVDEAFGAQMAERARLLAKRREDVLAVTAQGAAAAQELLDYLLAWLREHAPGYGIGSDCVMRPDRVEVAIDRTDPMGTLGHLVQEDLCLMEKQGEEHVLTAAMLCFPASWQLAEKIGRPLTAIHMPVAAYDPDIAQRVQRLFDGVREGRPLWRFNALRYADAALHQPRRRVQPTADAVYPYLRSERQCVLRLPQTRACVFSIHTYLIKNTTASGRVAAQD